MPADTVIANYLSVAALTLFVMYSLQALQRDKMKKMRLARISHQAA
jgi:hypothetical protein